MGIMKDIQDAINQAMGLASPPPKPNAFHYNEYGKSERKRIAAKGKKPDPRGDRRMVGNRPENAAAFYKRQAEAQAKREQLAREQQEANWRRQREIQENQGKGGDPTQGPWGGIW